MRISFQRGMRGFTLIEVAIVAAIVLITAIIGIPAINTYVIENKVPKVGQDLQRFVARVKVASQGLGNTPYAEMNNAQLVSGLRGSSVVSIAGSGAAAVVQHGLGAASGRIVAGPASIMTASDAFSLTLDQLNGAACPGLAAVMQRVAERITVNGQVVKQLGAGGEQGRFSVAAVEEACAEGDANTLVFVTR